MKFIVMYRSRLFDKVYGEWHIYSEHDNMYDAKQSVKAIKKWLGYKGGSVKIVTK